MAEDNNEKFIQQAITLAAANVRSGGGPFGAVIVKDGEIIASGVNMVTRDNDPSAHAEITAIRHACRQLATFKLDGCAIYISCEPCPMCLAAIYWAGIEEIYYGATRQDASAIGFADEVIYEEMGLEPARRRIVAQQIGRDEALGPMRDWDALEDKVPY
ncbi:MAG: nucleoside deaminase [Thermodesulfobacteriota bacterium]